MKRNNRPVTPVPKWGLGKVLHYADENGGWSCWCKFRVEEIRIRKGTVMYMGEGVGFEESLCEPSGELAARRWRTGRRRRVNAPEGT